MHETKFSIADPWLHQPQQAWPQNLAFVCAFQVELGITAITEAVYFRRSAEGDELWLLRLNHCSNDPGIEAGNVSLENMLNRGCVYAMPSEGDELAAYSLLLDALFRSYVGFAWPQRFIAGGMINEPMFKEIRGRLEKELDENHL